MRTVLALAVAAVAAAALAQTAAAADECRGLPVCLPVAGPWVAIPGGDGGTTATWRLTCPLRNYVVAGTDARLADPAIDVSYRAELGSPVSPGVATGRFADFTGLATGAAPLPTSFRPFIGCIPTSGGGGRAQTGSRHRSVQAVRPTDPVTRRVVTRRLVPGAALSVVARCTRSERLVGWSRAVGWYTGTEPPARVLAYARASARPRGGSVVARATLDKAVPATARVELQLHVLCAKGGK